MEVLAIGEDVDIVVGEVEEEGAVLVGLKRFNQTTKYFSRVYQQMLPKRILHNILGQSVSSKMTEKQGSSVFSSTLTAIQVYLKERPLSHMMIQVLLRVPFNGLMGKTLMESQSK